MRALACSFFLLPGFALADTIPLHAPVKSVAVYPRGATVTRQVPFSVPKGQHNLVITNLPDSVDLETVRAKVEGAVLGAVTLQDRRTLPSEAVEVGALLEARHRVDGLEKRLREVEDQRQDILMQADVAEAQIGFLNRLDTTQDAPLSSSAIETTVEAIGHAVLKAKQEAAKARKMARQFDEEVEDLKQELDTARQTVEALAPPEADNITLTLAVRAEQDADGLLTLTHQTGSVYWQPAYDLYLTRDEAAALRMERGAFISQDTDENWNDVQIQLTTTNLHQQMEPWRPFARGYSLETKAAVEARERARLEAAAKAGELYASSMADPVVEPEIVEEEASPSFEVADGLSVTYIYPFPISLASSAEAIRLSLGSLEFEAELYAKANLKSDSTAYLMAGFINKSEEIILGTDLGMGFVDGRLVGKVEVPTVVPGAKRYLGFGTIEGLRIEQRVLDKKDGDSGMIASKNSRSESREFTIENFTATDWDMRLLSSVPYSKHDDLSVTLKASPAVDEINVYGKRGLLAWDQMLPAGETLTIQQSYTMEWPEEMVLK